MIEQLIGGFTREQLNTIASMVCTKCVTQRTCSMYRYRNDTRYGRRLQECSTVKAWLLQHPEMQPQVVNKPLPEIEQLATHTMFPPELQAILEKADNQATDIIAVQAREHPDTIEALYGDPTVEQMMQIHEKHQPPQDLMTTEAGLRARQDMALMVIPKEESNGKESSEGVRKEQTPAENS